MSDTKTKPPENHECNDDSIFDALSAAYDPMPIESAVNDRLIEEALSRHERATADVLLDSSATERARAAGREREPLDPTDDEREPLDPTDDERELLDPTDDEREPLDPTDDERDRAEALAHALADGSTHPLFDLAEQLRAAYAPSDIDELRAEALLGAALASIVHAEGLPIHTEPPKSMESPSGANRAAAVIFLSRRWSYVAATAAMAASVALWLLPPPFATAPSNSTPVPALAQSRSVAPLFVENFNRNTATQRIDRIYAVRSRELRQNRYTTWRVR